jgi:hypothetical protein
MFGVQVAACHCRQEHMPHSHLRDSSGDHMLKGISRMMTCWVQAVKRYIALQNLFVHVADLPAPYMLVHRAGNIPQYVCGEVVA